MAEETQNTAASTVQLMWDLMQPRHHSESFTTCTKLPAKTLKKAGLRGAWQKTGAQNLAHSTSHGDFSELLSPFWGYHDYPKKGPPF